MKNATITTGSHVKFQDLTALVLSAKSGWLELEFPDKSTMKARAGKCTLMPMHEAIAETLEAEETVEEIDVDERCERCGERNRNCQCQCQPIEETEPAAEFEPIDLTCPECEHTFLLKRPKLSVQCPKCGAWIQVRIKADLTHYVRGLGVTPSGHDTLDIGDETADIFRGLTADDAIRVAAGRLIRIGQANMTRGFRKAYNGHTSGAWNLEAMVSYLQDRYGSRNNGMVRMNCGNLVRAAARRAAEQI